ncbi:chlorophyll synthase, chloroplastic-like isoform X3 [Brassica napus]|uniref:chlorophyll synthase, chloroplastic-like isoform X3 n=1 Tax=Brassica napus TaxID=3708 RepID=UPI000BBF167B|nr:chlorophyll synthase, chloroplastic-like isoform X3 [Brassica napus]XP_048595179.1 chlorophyll synthase, chloroplastic-like isoform X3 [Brassica napus]
MSCAFLCHRLIMLVLCLVVGALRDSSQSGALGASRHTTPALFYLALGGSLLSYIYSAPPLKLGIAIVYNFKSVEGDRAMGLQSLLVAFGTEAAKWICVSAIDVTQISVAGM